MSDDRFENRPAQRPGYAWEPKPKHRRAAAPRRTLAELAEARRDAEDADPDFLFSLFEDTRRKTKYATRVAYFHTPTKATK